MPKLAKSMGAWNSGVFEQTLKHEILGLEAGVLPLDKGVAQGGYVDESDLSATVLGATDDEIAIHARIGVFFTEVVANCGCGAELMPTNAYCEIQVRINKRTADAKFTVLSDQ
jgi:hypothetical protein